MKQNPALPSLRELTRQLRQLHAAWSHPDAGGEYVGLTLAKKSSTREPHAWVVRVAGESDHGELQFGREYIPGSVERECSACPQTKCASCGVCNGTGRMQVPCLFDAVASARRLLAAARDGAQ